MRMLFDYMPFRGCPICARILIKNQWLCISCCEQLNLELYDKDPQRARRLVNEVFVRKKPLPLLYLWEWGPRNDELISPYVQSLKGGFPLFAISNWVDELIRISQLEEPSLSFSNSLFVPAPAARLGVPDHAWKLSEALSHRTGAPMLPLLRREPKATLQKFQSRIHRQRLRMDSILGPGSRAKLKLMEVHFVDDIVTTGSTARAAWEALGKPPRFRIWSLIYRSRLLP